MLCTLLTSETKDMITAKELSLMKPTATLVNVARGGERDHPLLKLPNVIITPHFRTATENTRMKVMEVAVMNLKAGLKGEKLPFGVN